MQQETYSISTEDSTSLYYSTEDGSVKDKESISYLHKLSTKDSKSYVQQKA